MKNRENINFLLEHFNFLIANYNFKVKDIESYNYALYAKFVSHNVGIYFIYEFREPVPQIQFSILNAASFKIRPGIYTLREFYKNKDFKLQSFYLDEILSFADSEDYKSFFQNAKTIEGIIKASSELVKNYAVDFIKGTKTKYCEMDKWFRKQLSESRTGDRGKGVRS